MMRSRDGGFALAEAILSLAIAGAVLATLATVTGFVLAQRDRMAREEQDVSQALSLTAILDQLFEERFGGPDGLVVAADRLELRSTGLPLGSALARPVVVEIGPGSSEKTTLALRIKDLGREGLEGGLSVQPILRDLQRFEFSARVNNVWTPQWSGGEPEPSAIRVRWQRKQARPREYVARLARPATPAICLRQPSFKGCPL